jgi:hypothetical protein
MSDASHSNIPPFPKYGSLTWLQDGASTAVSARFSERLRLHVNAGEVEGVMRYISGVVLVKDASLQAAAFYATDTEYAKQLAYQLAVVIAPDFGEV